jgi:hypothetical protein
MNNTLAVSIIRGYEEINKGIDKFIKSVAHVDETIHTLACSALTHASEHGDNTLCTRLVNAMPKSGRKAALVEWFVKFGALTWVKIGEEQKFKKSERRAYNLDGAYITPFYDLTPDTVPKPFDLKMLLKMIEQATKKATKGRSEGSLTVNSEGYNMLSEAIDGLLKEVTSEAVMRVAMQTEEVKQAA